MSKSWKAMRLSIFRAHNLYAVITMIAATGLIVPVAEHGLDWWMSCDRPLYWITADRENDAGIEKGIKPTYRISLQNHCKQSFTNLSLTVSVHPTSATLLDISKGTITTNESRSIELQMVSPKDLFVDTSELAANTSVRMDFFSNQAVTAGCVLRATGPKGAFLSQKNHCVVYNVCSRFPNICHWWYTSQP